MISKAIIKKLPENWVRPSRIGYKILKAALHDFSSDHPVLVYAMPKAGTSTVESSLKNADISVYKVHRLSTQGIALSIAQAKEGRGVRFFNIQKLAKVIRHKVDSNPNNSWKIVTLTRDPISQAVSGLFQGIEYVHPEMINAQGQVNVGSAIEYLQQRFKKYAEGDPQSDWYNLKWFERELEDVFKIDIYNYPYNFDQGFLYIHQGNIEVLTIRMEDLNNSFPYAAQKLLELPEPVSIKSENTAQSKQFNEAYKQVKSQIKVPRSACEKIYSSRYARHFYTQAERRKFIKKWSREA